MVHVPLIPQTKKPENFDISHVLQEAFQDFIDPDEFCENVTKNVCRGNLENASLKKTCKEVTDAYDGTKLSMDDIAHTEHQIMVSQAKYLKEENVTNKDIMLLESLKLSRKHVFEDIDPEDVCKYSLLQKKDLLPSKAMMSMDFRLNSNRHLCCPPCETPSVCRDVNDETCGSTRLQKQFVRKPDKEKLEVIFKAEPNTIEFLEYRLGVTYKKKFKLRNVTRGTRTFIPRYPKDSCFKVELHSGISRVPPGMFAVFSVKFTTEIYKDLEEKMTVDTFTGEEVVIKFISYRTPPCLLAFIYKDLEHFQEKYPVNYGSGLKYSEERQLALNSSIDCGGCLLGNMIEVVIVIKNQGNDGKFFLLSEEEWYFSEVTFRCPDGELTMGSFTIHPTYFEIKKNEYIQLSIAFAANEYGLAVEKLFLLCDNNTVEELEVIADGIVFDKTNVVLDPVHISRTYERNEEVFDVKCAHSINFKQCLPNHEYVRIITVLNNTCIDYNYKWVVRDTISDFTGIRFNRLNSDWIKLRNPPLYLAGNGFTDFEILLLCPCSVEGLHSMVLCLHVVDVPKRSLAENSNFCILERSEDELQSSCSVDNIPVLDIAVAQIEVAVNFVPITIIFNPAEIRIVKTLEVNSHIKQELQITTLNDVALQGLWTVSDACVVKISPVKVDLLPNVVYVCFVKIRTHHYKDINETLTFKVLNSSYKREFNVSVKVVKPKARFLTNSLNFGIVPRGENIAAKKIKLQNIGQDIVEWYILECAYDFNLQKVVYFNPLKRLSKSRGILLKEQKDTVTYCFDSTEEVCRWVSFLILVSVHPSQIAMDSVCITYEVAEPNIKIYSCLSQFPQIFPGRLLYLGCRTQYKLCMHNYSEKIAGSFKFGTPQGCHANCFDVSFEPRCAVVCTKSCVHVMMTITPLRTGVFDDIAIPCHIEFSVTPVVLTINCVVDNIHLHYLLPDRQGKLLKIFWPDDVSHSDDDTAEGEMSSTMESSSLDIYKKNSVSSSINSVNCDCEQLSSEYKLNTESDSIQTSDVCDCPPIQDTSQLSLKDCFTEDLELHENIIEFKNVPLKTPVKKTISIENLTPILGDFHVCATNFFPIYPEETKERAFEQMLEDIHIKPKNDEWDELVNTKYGIVVHFNPSFGCVSSVNIVDIDIWVYANTWGAYIEEVIIYVNDIQPFYFNLFIEAIGIPIEYPMGINSILEEIVLRFGSYAYLSEPIVRKLKIKNYGCIPLHVVWHTFLLGGQPTTFNLLMETFDHTPTTSINSNTTDMSMKVLITNKYHGVSDNLIFQVSPISVKLKPKATKELKIIFDSKTIPPKFEKTELEGLLVGYVHISNKYKFQSKTYVRKTDIDINQATVKLQGTLELPILELNLLQGDLKIGAFANDIIEAHEINYERTLIFRNTNSSVAEVSMYIQKPFRVVNLKTIYTKMGREYQAASVPQNCCLQALVECIMDAEQVLRYSDMLFNSKTTIFPEIVNYVNNSVIIKRDLEILQDGVKCQVVPMEFTIFYPNFQVSTKTVPFEVVFVGNTKMNLLTLYNTTGNAIPFSVHKLPLSSAFQVIPARGTIPKSNGRVRTSATVNVYFTPSESRIYQETIRVAANIPFLHVNVILTGSGTLNEKFYVEGAEKCNTISS